MRGDGRWRALQGRGQLVPRESTSPLGASSVRDGRVPLGGQAHSTGPRGPREVCLFVGDASHYRRDWESSQQKGWGQLRAGPGGQGARGLDGTLLLADDAPIWAPHAGLPAEAWLNTAQGTVGAARGLGGSRSSGPALRPLGWLKAVPSEDTRDPPCANRCSVRCRVGTREPQQADTHNPPCSRTRGAGRPTPRPHRRVHVLLAILWHLHDGAHDGARGQQGTPRPEDARRGVQHLRGWGEGTRQLGRML